MNLFRQLSISITIFMIIISFFIMPASTYSEAQPEMQVHFIDVGQGDSMLIQTPSNKNILIDAGPPKSGKRVVNYLKKHHIKEIDLLIATHPDIDHIGGLPLVMKSVKVDQILDSGKMHSTKTYAKYLYQIRAQAIPFKIAKQKEKIEVDPLLDIRILNSSGQSKNNNQSSIALKLTYGDIDFLLMSDVEREQEKELLDKFDLEAEIIKVAHHGSNTSTSAEFLKHVKPKVAMLTYSKTNDFGHPVNRVIENLYKMDALIYSTAAFGNVVITTDGKDYFVIPEKNPAEGILEKAN
ncbi:beta-lactamase superfamily II metal-dependent hydrolase [Virgibacillus halotolerans]|uniref:ComEC/Rec2 family competence protein n=1 Tax=Virgibacillus halotolerans TaxID=1071053 RepID=UPI0019607639|nr:ComEC/Rec2 family competence protein [Virgibacillus halotolerans]MBM7601960.1 beta-lactamase superfamily II metal-dependent hydrolase [Virgibacillus halotolerans]